MMDSDLQRLAAACNKAAEHYCTHPGHAGPETIIDIYRAMAALAAMMDDMIHRRDNPVYQKRLN